MKKSNKIWVMAVFLIGLSLSIGTIPIASGETSSVSSLSIVHSVTSETTIAKEYVGWSVMVEHYFTYDGEPRLKISVSGYSENINANFPSVIGDGISVEGYVMVTSDAREKWYWGAPTSVFNAELTDSHSKVVRLIPEDRFKMCFRMNGFEGHFSFCFILRPVKGYEDACSEEQFIYTRFTKVNAVLGQDTNTVFDILCSSESIDYLSGVYDGCFCHYRYRAYGTVSIALERDGGSDIPSKPPIGPTPIS